MQYPFNYDLTQLLKLEPSGYGDTKHLVFQIFAFNRGT